MRLLRKTYQDAQGFCLICVWDHIEEFTQPHGLVLLKTTYAPKKHRLSS